MSDSSSGRLLEVLRQWISTAPPGSQLPPTRRLVAEHQVSPVTVQKALRQLGSEGLVDSRPGVGTFTRAARPVRAADYGWQTAALRSPHPRTRVSVTMGALSHDVIGLHAGYPDRDLLPQRLVQSALARAGRGSAALTRPPVSGLPELQDWFARELAALTRPEVAAPAAGDTVVLPGSQSGLSSVFRALVGHDRPLIVESPTYWGAIAAARQAGVRLVPVPAGPDGPDPRDVARAFEETGARAFYAQPTYANPTGAQWSADRTEQVLEVVREHGAFLVEDDWAHDFGITTSVLPAAALDDAGHVVYLRSLTKSVSPAIRVAAVIARGPARERILTDRAAEGMYVSGLLQAAALEIVTHPGWARHVRAVRDQLRARRDLMAAGLRSLVPEATLTALPAGGLNLWVRLPDGTDVARLVQDCERSGVLVAPGDEWFPAEPEGPYVRLNYSGPRPEAFEAGLRVVGEALASQRPRGRGPHRADSA